MQEDIKKAIEVLRAGGIILYPTDTIWGIGCDATNEDAVKNVYAIKQRAENKAMIVLLPSYAMLESYVGDVPEVAFDLMDLSEKPLTIIFEGAKGLAHNLLGEHDSVGIRIPKDAFLERLLMQFKKPIVSTSANVSGTPSPIVFADIVPSIKDQVDYVVGYGQDNVEPRVPSSILQLKPNGEVKVIRE